MGVRLRTDQCHTVRPRSRVHLGPWTHTDVQGFGVSTFFIPDLLRTLLHEVRWSKRTGDRGPVETRLVRDFPVSRPQLVDSKPQSVRIRTKT